MASIASVYVEILPATGKIAAGIAKALRDVDDEARDAAKRWRKEIEAQMRGVDVEVDADTAKAKKEIQAVEKGHYTAKVDVEVDQASLAKARALIGGAGGGGGRGGLPGGGLGGAAKVFGATQAIGLAPNVVPLIGSMVQGVGQLSGVLGLIPAAAGAAGLAIGSLKIATAGFGDAVKAVGDPKKFSEAIAQLAPNAQGAATAIQGLMPQVTQLKMTVQDAGFQGMGDQITKLGNTYLPMFRTTMSQMAASANKALRGVGDMFQTPEMKADVKTFTTNAATAFDILSGALQPVVRAFSDIAVVGSDFLPGLATTVKDLATRFSEFIRDARDTGKLHDWIQGGITAFGKLKDIVVNIGTTLRGIFTAADTGGQGFLTTIEKWTQKLSDFVNSDVGQQKLKTLFTDARTELEKWKPVLDDLPGIATNAFNGMKTASDTWFPVIRDLTQMLKDHPGLVQVAAGAYVAWQAIPGVTALSNSLGIINTLLKVTLPASAVTGAAGISAAFAALGPITITATVVVAAVMAGDALTEWLFEHDPLKNFRPGGLNTPPFLRNTPTTPSGQPVPGLVPGSPIQRPQLTDAQRKTLEYQGINPDTAKVEDVYRALGIALPVPAPGQDASPTRSENRTSRGPAPAVPAIPNYSPPTPATPGATGNGGSGGAGDKSGWSADWDQIAGAESGGNWAITYGEGPDVTGGLQIATATWLSHGGTTPKAYMASKAEQIAVAERILADPNQGPDAWPTTYRNHPDWFRPPGTPTPSTSSYGYTGPHDPRLQLTGKGNQGQQVSITPSAQFVGENLLQQFPGITNIGTVRPDKLQWHPSGRGLDINFPDPMGAGNAMGDQIAAYLKANQEALGIANVLWEVADHFDHIHVGLKEGISPALQQYASGGYDGPGGDRNNPMYTEDAKDTGGKQLGQDIVSGMMEIFGLGDIFPDPTQFGLFKIFKGFMGLKPKDQDNGSGSGSGGGGGGGGSLVDTLMSFIPQPFGALNSGSPDNAPGEFIPGQSSGGGGSIADFLTGLIPSAVPETGKPAVDNSMHVSIGDTKADTAGLADFLTDTFLQHSRSNLNSMPSK